MQRKIIPKAADDLPFPLPVWTMIRPLLSVFVAMILSRAAFFLAIFIAWRSLSAFAGVSVISAFLLDQIVGRGGPVEAFFPVKMMCRFKVLRIVQKRCIKVDFAGLACICEGCRRATGRAEEAFLPEGRDVD
jgi:hypothetical protein